MVDNNDGLKTLTADERDKYIATMANNYKESHSLGKQYDNRGIEKLTPDQVKQRVLDLVAHYKGGKDHPDEKNPASRPSGSTESVADVESQKSQKQR